MAAMPHQTVAADSSYVTKPLVSVLVRSTDRPTLSRALNSISSQTYPAIEILVVSASGSVHAALPAMWNNRPLRFLSSNAKLSRPLAANALLASANGRYLNFLDDDDEFLPNHVQTLVDALMRTEQTRLAYSICRVYDSEGVDRGRLGKPGHHLLMFHQNRFAIHAALFDRSLIDQGLRFDTKFDRLEDLDFFVACGARTNFAFVPEETCVWNAFDGQSGMGFASNFDSSQQQRFTQMIREKWRKQFEKWGKDPEGILAVAESAAAFGRLDVSAKLLVKVRHISWPDEALRGRVTALSSLLNDAPATAAR